MISCSALALSGSAQEHERRQGQPEGFRAPQPAHKPAMDRNSSVENLSHSASTPIPLDPDPQPKPHAMSHFAFEAMSKYLWSILDPKSM